LVNVSTNLVCYPTKPITFTAKISNTMPTPEDILKQHWGYNSFRPLQRDIIQSVLEGRDTLALMPTGGGKSICFQVPALCTEGVCVVVSPLIALMKDQVQNLRKRDIAAAAIFSGMDYRDIDRIFDNAVYGGLKFLYLSPERLTTDLARERLKRMTINLLAVDEAHCVSQWGYDFRPPYLQVAAIREFLPKTPILALTATATADVAKDICGKLEFRKDHAVFEQDFSRPNLSYLVRTVEDKQAKLLQILTKSTGSAVVYVRNRRLTKEIAQVLNYSGIQADFYHAGLANDERSQKQDSWTTGKTRVMVATNAFGMGIDKPDVRVVVHLDLPDGLEAYFQEAGRAGRDGLKSYAVLLYKKSDAEDLVRQFEQSYPEMKDIRRVYEAIGSYLQLAVGGGEGESFDFDLAEFTQRYQFDALKTVSALKVLEHDGWLAYTEGGYLPSRLKFIVSREKLYDFELRHKDHERVIKGLLRALPQVMTDYVIFNEFTVAQFIKISVMDLEKSLHHFQNEGLLDYRPKKDKAQLTFLRERIESQNLSINWSLYMFRKKRAEARLKKAIEYAELDVCRSQQLVHYFGQTDAPTCGVCDVCVEKKNIPLDDTDFEQLSDKISRLLRREPLPLKEIVDSFADRQKTKVIQTLGYMLDSKVLKKEGDKFALR
jgi:ATP-dependent DNA helicase RecQ